jgi:MFS transporter, Spinster family, sphingosine-1-phosphate transporter
MWVTELAIIVEEIKEILSNRHFVMGVGGQVAGNFALGGLAEWFPTYLLRYDGAGVSLAGLIVGGATVAGGVLGNVIGAKVADYFQFKVKSAYFLIPALFMIPAGICLLLAVNISDNLIVTSALLFACEVFIWTYLAPISALCINVIRPDLRARSCGKRVYPDVPIGFAIF